MSDIARVEIGRFDYDICGEFKFFNKDADGQMRRPSVLVRLTDEDGVQGWGQAVPVPTWTYETVESVQTTLEFYLAPAVLGADPEGIEDVHRRMERVIRPGYTTGQPLAKAAIDLACYDLAGKQQDERTVNLLGGTRVESLQLNWTIASHDMAVVEQELERGKARGYTNFTVKLGSPQTPEYDLELVRKVKDFAPEGFLWADANTGYDLDTVLEILPKLADAGLEVLESPLPPTNIRGYQRLKRTNAVPIVMDEGMIAPEVVAEYISLDVFDGIAMKPARCAGLYPSQKIISLLQENGLMVLGSGLSDPDISLAAAVHLYAWAGLQKPCALNGPQFLCNTLTTDNFIPKSDRVFLPAGPGLGLRLDSHADDCLKIVAQS